MSGVGARRENTGVRLIEFVASRQFVANGLELFDISNRLRVIRIPVRARDCVSFKFTELGCFYL